MTVDDADLKNASLRGGAVTASAQVIKLLIQFASTVILARLFTPADFGLIAMIGAILALISNFQDMGLSTATIQKQAISEAQISNLFWINVLFSLGLTAIAAAAAPLIAWFYKEPRLAPMVLVLSSSFLICGLGVQHQALLMRRFRFGRQAGIEIVALICGIAAAVLFHELGYWALVLLTLTNRAVNTLGLWLLTAWHPGLPRRRTQIRPLLTFGLHISGMNIITYITRNLDNVLIGWSCGAVPLGFYSRAYNLFLLPISQLIWPFGSVAVPVLSRLQHERDRFRLYYLSAIRLILFVIVPASIILIIHAREVVLLLLGKKWLPAVPILRYLCLCLPFQPLYSCSSWLYVTLGRTRELLKYGSTGTVLIVSSFFIGLPFAGSGVALSYSLCILMWTWPAIHFACRGSGVTVKDHWRVIREPLTAALAAGTCLLLLEYGLRAYFVHWAIVALGLVSFFFVYIGVSFWIFSRKKFYLKLITDFWRLLAQRT